MGVEKKDEKARESIKDNRTKKRHDDGYAFIADPGDGPAHTDDVLAQELAEEFLWAVTSGEPADEALDEEVTEEQGGPFVTTPASREFAYGTDESNPADAERESLPSPMRGS